MSLNTGKVSPDGLGKLVIFFLDPHVHFSRLQKDSSCFVEVLCFWYEWKAFYLWNNCNSASFATDPTKVCIERNQLLRNCVIALEYRQTAESVRRFLKITRSVTLAFIWCWVRGILLHSLVLGSVLILICEYSRTTRWHISTRTTASRITSSLFLLVLRG